MGKSELIFVQYLCTFFVVAMAKRLTSFHTDTEGAIKSVRINRVSVFIALNSEKM